MLKVVALGNSLRGDDGIGIAVLDELKKNNLVQKVVLLDIGSDAFTLLEHFIQTEPMLLIDCARMGKSPGEVAKFCVDQTNLARANEMVSLHGFSLAETYQMAQKLGNVADCHIIGIEPKTIEFNRDISPEVRKSIPVVIEMVMEKIEKYEK